MIVLCYDCYIAAVKSLSVGFSPVESAYVSASIIFANESNYQTMCGLLAAAAVLCLQRTTACYSYRKIWQSIPSPWDTFPPRLSPGKVSQPKSWDILPYTYVDY